MAKTYTLSRFLKEIGTSLLRVTSVVACAGLPGIGPASWKEEAFLHDGSKIVVSRSVSRGGRHEVGQEGTYQEQSLSLTIPKSNRNVRWEDHRSEDLGSSNFLPMLLDVYGDVAYLVVAPMGCLSYNKWGRPNPPYIIFKNEGKAWQQIPLSELPAESRATNLIFSAPDLEVERSGTRFMTAEMIRAVISRDLEPEFRTVLRESVKPVKGAGLTSCIEMYPDGKGGWLGADWFRHKTREQCTQFCAEQSIAAEVLQVLHYRRGKIAMITDLEYALMAGGSYISTRGPKNQFPVPPDWFPENEAWGSGLHNCIKMFSQSIGGIVGTVRKLLQVGNQMA